MGRGYREKCIGAKGNDCTVCGDSPVVVHHLDADRTNSDLDNLIPVCDSCHKKIHWGTDGYEDYHEQLPPRAQWGDADPDATTSITLNAALGERLRDMKPPGASWDTFILGLLEDLTGPEQVSLTDDDVERITEQLGDDGVAIRDGDRDAIADVVADRVVDSLRTLRR